MTTHGTAFKLDWISAVLLRPFLSQEGRVRTGVGPEERLELERPKPVIIGGHK